MDHDCSEKLILLDFSSSRLVAVSVPFPEVQIRKGTESGLGVALLDRRGWTLLSPPAIQFFHSVPANKALITKKPIYNLKRYFCWFVPRKKEGQRGVLILTFCGMNGFVCVESSRDCLTSLGGASLCGTSCKTFYHGCLPLLCSKPLNTLMLGLPHQYIIRLTCLLTSYGQGAWCGSVARDKRPGSVCLPACPTTEECWEKQRQASKGFLDGASWPGNQPWVRIGVSGRWSLSWTPPIKFFGLGMKDRPQILQHGSSPGFCDSAQLPLVG